MLLASCGRHRPQFNPLPARDAFGTYSWVGNPISRLAHSSRVADQIVGLADPRLRREVHRILTARAASKTSTVREMIDWSIISTLPQRANTGTSVGEKAVLVLKAMKR